MQKRSNRSWRKNREGYSYFLRKADRHARERALASGKFNRDKILINNDKDK